MSVSYTHLDVYKRQAFAKCKEMFAAQGGDTRVLDDYSLFEQPAASFELLAEQDGYIVANDAEKIGSASVLLGAGRQKKGDPLDFAAGITLHKKRGDYVKKARVWLPSTAQQTSLRLLQPSTAAALCMAPKSRRKLRWYMRL